MVGEVHITVPIIKVGVLGEQQESSPGDLNGQVSTTENKESKMSYPRGNGTRQKVNTNSAPAR